MIIDDRLQMDQFCHYIVNEHGAWIHWANITASHKYRGCTEDIIFAECGLLIFNYNRQGLRAYISDSLHCKIVKFSTCEGGQTLTKPLQPEQSPLDHSVVELARRHPTAHAVCADLHAHSGRWVPADTLSRLNPNPWNVCAGRHAIQVEPLPSQALMQPCQFELSVIK